MVRCCGVDSSISCVLPRCLAGSIEICNRVSGRFSPKSPKGSSVNFGVLRGSRFTKFRSGA